MRILAFLMVFWAGAALAADQIPVKITSDDHAVLSEK